MDTILGLFCCLIAVGLLTLLFLFAKEIQQQKLSQKKQLSSNTNFQKSKNHNSSNISHLQKKLLLMVGGDHTVIQRLITNLQAKYPEQTETWHWEKAIFDLERDRHF